MLRWYERVFVVVAGVFIFGILGTPIWISIYVLGA
jgi:hypothetical protein